MVAAYCVHKLIGGYIHRDVYNITLYTISHFVQYNTVYTIVPTHWTVLIYMRSLILRMAYYNVLLNTCIIAFAYYTPMSKNFLPIRRTNLSSPLNWKFWIIFFSSPNLNRLCNYLLLFFSFVSHLIYNKVRKANSCFLFVYY